MESEGLLKTWISHQFQVFAPQNHRLADADYKRLPLISLKKKAHPRNFVDTVSPKYKWRYTLRTLPAFLAASSLLFLRSLVA